MYLGFRRPITTNLLHMRCQAQIISYNAVKLICSMVLIIVVVPPFSVHTQFEELEKSLPGLGIVCAGMTCQLLGLEDKVYMIYEASNRIQVFNPRIPFSVLEEIRVKDLKSPYDVAACATSNCLYVTDLETRCIWKIMPSDRQATRWLSNLGEPFTLSMSSDGRVIVPRDGQPSFVEIYNSDAVLVQNVRLPAEIQHAKRVIETPTGNLILLHRCSNHSSVVLSAVTKNGDTVHRYTPGDEGELLNDGCRLSIVPDGNNFHVLAIDCDNRRTIEFKSDIKEGVIINSDYTAVNNNNSNA